MRKSAVTLARAIAFIEASDLLSGTKQSVPSLIARVAERYSFENFPKSRDERGSKDGAQFFDGASDLGPIVKLTIYNTGFVLDTEMDTSVSQAIIEEMLEWGETELGIKYHHGMVKKFGYLSDVTFFSDAPLLIPHAALTNLAKATTRAVSGIWQEDVQYDGLSLQIGHDPLKRKFGISPIKIERRSEHLFSEHKYFSEAPLPTDMHWSFLEQYEKDVLHE